MRYELSTRITRYVVWGFMGLLVLLALLAPKIIRWYVEFRHMGPVSERVILTAFYVCAPVAGTALYAMERILRNFLKGQVFVSCNVRYTRLISLCCLLVAVATVFGGIGYPPLWFVALLMGFLSLVVLVVAQVLKAATAIREENDLTI